LDVLPLTQVIVDGLTIGLLTTAGTDEVAADGAGAGTTAGAS
jgi:hypothetical protein